MNSPATCQPPCIRPKGLRSASKRASGGTAKPTRQSPASSLLQEIEGPTGPGDWPAWPHPPRIAEETVLVPAIVATGVWEEVCVWLGEELPREWQLKLMDRAEAVYATNAGVRRRLRGSGNGGRDWLWIFMRHWLAALIQHYRPALYARLPTGFSTGHPLPEASGTQLRWRG